MVHDQDIEEKSPAMRFAERLFKIMDENEDGQLTIEEFVKGFHKLKSHGTSYGKTIVTAYVTERKLTAADWEPKPAIPLRRKSLRDGSKLKNLFNNNEKKDCSSSSDAAAAENDNKLVNKAVSDEVAVGDDHVLTKAVSAAVAATAAYKMSAKAKILTKKDDSAAKAADSTEAVVSLGDDHVVTKAASAAIATTAFSKIAAKSKAKMLKKGNSAVKSSDALTKTASAAVVATAVSKLSAKKLKNSKTAGNHHAVTKAVSAAVAVTVASKISSKTKDKML